MTFYERFEHAVVLVLTAPIAIVVASAAWQLASAVIALVSTQRLDPADQRVFQAVFGMIFTVVIALEFKHSLLAVLERRGGVVRVHTVVLIALLAVKEAGPATLFALAAAILALGVVYWLVRDQDRRACASAGGRGTRHGSEGPRRRAGWLALLSCHRRRARPAPVHDDRDIGRPRKGDEHHDPIPA